MLHLPVFCCSTVSLPDNPWISTTDRHWFCKRQINLIKIHSISTQRWIVYFIPQIAGRHRRVEEESRRAKYRWEKICVFARKLVSIRSEEIKTCIHQKYTKIFMKNPTVPCEVFCSGPTRPPASILWFASQHLFNGSPPPRFKQLLRHVSLSHCILMWGRSDPVAADFSHLNYFFPGGLEPRSSTTTTTNQSQLYLSGRARTTATSGKYWQKNSLWTCGSDRCR